jgi:hypothetical protein
MYYCFATAARPPNSRGIVVIGVGFGAAFFFLFAVGIYWELNRYRKRIEKEL